MYHKTLLILTLYFALSSCCQFLWKNGKKTVDCTDKDLLNIPDSLEADTQILEFSGNKLRSLDREKFLRHQLINLQKIFLSGGRISVINGQAFKGLAILVELDLSDNLLESVPSESFKDLPSLRRLSLSRNPIEELGQNAFKSLPLLRTLELGNCDISKVHPHTFDGLDKLEILRLESNEIKTFPALLPASLKDIQLQRNPWNCDCDLLDFQRFLIKFPYLFSHDVYCKTPISLEGRKIKSLSEKDFPCLPDVSPTELKLKIYENKNMSLVCQVRAVPEAVVNWYFEGQLLKNDSDISPELHSLYYVEEGSEDKRSELFIININSRDSGTYTCNAANSFGVSTTNFTVQVLSK